MNAREDNLGSFAARSGSNATTSAEGSDSESIEDRGNVLNVGYVSVVAYCFPSVVILLVVGRTGAPILVSVLTQSL